MRILGLGDNVFDIYQNLGWVYPGGNAVNTAVSARRLGCEAAYMGRIADDAWGHIMLGALRAEQVDTSLCELVPHTTTKRCIEKRTDSERTWIKNELGEAPVGPLELTEELAAKACSFDAILTSCNAKTADQLGLLDARQGTLAFDFGEKDKYRTLDYLGAVLPHIDLAQFSLAGASDEALHAFIDSQGFACPVLITRGEQGSVFVAGDTWIEQPLSTTADAVDTMGAGDAFVSALVVGLLKRGWGRGKALPAPEAIKAALQEASEHAARMCQLEGAFGHGQHKRNLKAVVFDMDGVLVESEPYYVSVIRDFYKSQGISLTLEEENSIYGSSDRYQWQMAADKLGVSLEEGKHQFDLWFNSRPIKYNEVLIDGVRELLACLRSNGILCAVASSSFPEDIARMLRECELEDAFDYTVSGTEFKESKPNPEIYLHTLDKLGVCAAETLVVEDSNYGIEAAVRAGIDVLTLLKTHGETDTSHALLAFKTHREIQNYIVQVLEGSLWTE